ncbi:ribonuclease HII [Halalkalibacillus sediminis]|uniref:Ribonuclease HII n=1 Tax=Halalkalibacillus sediminis TaxID=2018042 RepID=A0A2I0QWB6_9BACI|nr:ribonuclease HII [Halalkalibacillus sediminis]PKR78604.1 ribonuclease HII [Halalkalibacillus sediminis]
MSNKESIAEIKAKLLSGTFSSEWKEMITKDSRKGVQQALNQYNKRQEKLEKLHHRFLEMSTWENTYWQEDHLYVAGVDEVGRGPLAGPVVAAAVILDSTFYLPGIDDSKKLSEKNKEDFFQYILQEAISVGVSVISHDQIDQMNIYESTKVAMKDAINNLEVTPHRLLLDAMELKDLPIEQVSLIKGDSKSISIAAASIVAKVTRDRLMKELHMDFPVYGWDKNMGYGTAEHLDGLDAHGPSPYHRKSFEPVKIRS